MKASIYDLYEEQMQLLNEGNREFERHKTHVAELKGKDKVLAEKIIGKRNYIMFLDKNKEISDIIKLDILMGRINEKYKKIKDIDIILNSLNNARNLLLDNMKNTKVEYEKGKMLFEVYEAVDGFNCIKGCETHKLPKNQIKQLLEDREGVQELAQPLIENIDYDKNNIILIKKYRKSNQIL